MPAASCNGLPVLCALIMGCWLCINLHRLASVLLPMGTHSEVAHSQRFYAPDDQTFEQTFLVPSAAMQC